MVSADYFETYPIADIPFIVNLFGDPTQIARALGLDIELPDPDQTDAAYWAEIHRTGWKHKLVGKVADQNLLNGHYDADWVLLIEKPFCAIWFDIEEGIRFRGKADQFAETIALVRSLEAKGIPFWWEDGDCLIRASQSMFAPGLPDLGPIFEAAGLVAHDNREGRPLWYQLAK
jgi:hypothetical protein